MTTIREATEARARAEGFDSARRLMKVLAEAGLSPSAITSALGAQQDELDTAATVAETEARDLVEHRAEARGSRAGSAPEPETLPGTPAE